MPSNNWKTGKLGKLPAAKRKTTALSASDAMTRHIREAESQLLHGNFEGALTLYERLFRRGCKDSSAFNDYRKLVRHVRGHDLPHWAVFNFIYDSAAWGVDGATGLGTSGFGSLQSGNRAYLEFLTAFLRDRDIRSVVDVGCGDWQLGSAVDWNGIEYIGVDVSSKVLENTHRFARSNVHFVEGDATIVDLPSADLLLMKDVLQHWSNAEVARFLPKIRTFKYALLTNGYEPFGFTSNPDIQSGDFRFLDLAAPPFSVTGSVALTYEVVVHGSAGEPMHEWKRVFLVVNELPG